MTRTFRIGDRDVDPADRAAVRALSADEFRELMALAIAADRDEPVDEAALPDFPSSDPAPGTAILLPTTRPELPA